MMATTIDEDDDVLGTPNHDTTSRPRPLPTSPPSIYATRFPKWVGLTVFSMIAWFATIGGVQRHSMDGAERWVLACTTLAFVLAAMAVGVYLFMGSQLHADPLPETSLAGFILLLWATGLPVIMNPKNSLAIGYTDHLNANLYFSSWFAFATVISIGVDIAKEWYSFDPNQVVQSLLEASNTSGAASAAHNQHPNHRRILSKWYALIVSSMIVMAASIRVYRAFPCSSQTLQQSPVCRQTKFAISAGAIGTILAVLSTILYMTGWCSRRRQIWLEGVVSMVMVIVWCFALRYVTFGEGPGTNVGNLFFATWASLGLSVWLLAEVYQEWKLQRMEQQQQQSGVSTTELSEMEATIPAPSSVPLESMADTDIL